MMFSAYSSSRCDRHICTPIARERTIGTPPGRARLAALYRFTRALPPAPILMKRAEKSCPLIKEFPSRRRCLVRDAKGVFLCSCHSAGLSRLRAKMKALRHGRFKKTQKDAENRLTHSPIDALPHSLVKGDRAEGVIQSWARIVRPRLSSANCFDAFAAQLHSL